MWQAVQSTKTHGEGKKKGKKRENRNWKKKAAELLFLCAQTRSKAALSEFSIPPCLFLPPFHHLTLSYSSIPPFLSSHTHTHKMAPIGQIYGFAGHPKVDRALAAAAYNGLELEIVETSAMKGDTKKPEYTAIFPFGKIPGFKGTDGLTLIEGKAIARYGKLHFSHIPSSSFFSPLSSSLYCPLQVGRRRQQQM